MLPPLGPTGAGGIGLGATGLGFPGGEASGLARHADEADDRGWPARGAGHFDRVSVAAGGPQAAAQDLRRRWDGPGRAGDHPPGADAEDERGAAGIDLATDGGEDIAGAGRVLVDEPAGDRVMGRVHADRQGARERDLRADRFGSHLETLRSPHRTLAPGPLAG